MSGRRFSSSDAIFEYLLGFVNVERGQKTEFKLDRMRELCERLGNPQNAYYSVHIAGSKGKGSVSAMIARILQAAGLRVGLYTSPHLLRWKERISLAGDEMPEDMLLEAMDEVLPLVEGKTAADFSGGALPTYFELTTLLGFCAFRRAGCEAAVIETGLGGRLDSTNVVDSSASVIMPIELEHTEWLGTTIPQIAFEKAGIIKPGKPCFLSPQPAEARDVFLQVCRERGSPLHEYASVGTIEEIALSRTGTKAVLTLGASWPPAKRLAQEHGPLRLSVETPLLGSVQAHNMALALMVSAELEERVGLEAIRNGLARSSLPARFQILDLKPPVILDGAHTPASVRLSLETLETLFHGPKDMLFACAHDKHHAEMAAILAPHFAGITVTRPGDFKMSQPRAVFESFSRQSSASRLIIDHKEAIKNARETAAARGRPLLIIGSFYLCAEAAALLGGRPGYAG